MLAGTYEQASILWGLRKKGYACFFFDAQWALDYDEVSDCFLIGYVRTHKTYPDGRYGVIPKQTRRLFGAPDEPFARVYRDRVETTLSQWGNDNAMRFLGFYVTREPKKQHDGFIVTHVLNGVSTITGRKVEYFPKEQRFQPSSYNVKVTDEEKRKEFHAALKKFRAVLRPRIKLRAFDYLNYADLIKAEHQIRTSGPHASQVTRFVKAVNNIDPNDLKSCEEALQILVGASRTWWLNRTDGTLCDILSKELDSRINRFRQEARLELAVDRYVPIEEFF